MLLDSTLIVIKSIKQITVILTTVVFILLLSCLNTNMFVPFKYIFFLVCIILSINPDNDQNTPIVPTIPINIGTNIFSAVFNSYTPPVTK